MSHDTLTLRDDLRKWLPVFRAQLGMSQNAFARAAEVDQSIFSRWLRGVITSAPTERKARRALESLRRRVLVPREKSA